MKYKRYFMNKSLDIVCTEPLTTNLLKNTNTNLLNVISRKKITLKTFVSYSP